MTRMDDYRLLGRWGLRVAPLSLGAMTFGDAWGWGADKQESKRIFDAYLDLGGNMIDTANIYTDGQSERYLGEFLDGRRDSVVVSTKYAATRRTRMRVAAEERACVVRSRPVCGTWPPTTSI